MKKNRLRGTLLGLTVSSVLAASGFTAHAQDKPDALELGVFTFMSGPAAAYGQPGRNGAELIIDQLNAAGGIDGVPLKATYVDEAQGAEGVISDYRRLADDPNTAAMIAALSSGNCLALAPIADQLKMPTIGWNCDTHQLFQKSEHPYYFRPNGNTVAEFVAYAAYVAKVKPDAKKIAIINPDYSFGHDAAQIFTAAMKAFNPDVEVVAELFPKMGTSSFQTEISRLSAARPDVVFSNLWGGDLENFLRQASPRGLLRTSQFVLALGESALQSTKLPDGVIVGVLGDGSWLSPDAQATPETVKFAEAYHDKFGSYPVFPAMKMVNSFMVLKAGYEKAIAANDGAWPTREQLAASMKDLSASTLTGKVTLREDNDGIVDQIVGMTVKSDKYDFPVMGNMIRFDGAALLPPVGEDPIAWISTLDKNLLASLPEPGSYK